MDAHFSVPVPRNEPVRGYAPGSPERISLQARVEALAAERLEALQHAGDGGRERGGRGLRVLGHARSLTGRSNGRV